MMHSFESPASSAMGYHPPFFSSMAEPEYVPQVHDYVHNWDEIGVTNWLKSINLGQYADTFRRHNVTGQVLLEIEPTILKDMGIDKIGDRVRIATQIKTFRKIECQRISRAQINRESLELLEKVVSVLPGSLPTRSSNLARHEIRPEPASNMFVHTRSASPYVDGDGKLLQTPRFTITTSGSIASPAMGMFTPSLSAHPNSMGASSRPWAGSYTGSQSSVMMRHMKASPSLEVAPTPTLGSFLPSDKPLIRVIFENANSSVVNIEGCKTADDVMLKSLRKGQLNESMVKSYCFYILDGLDPDPILCRRYSDAELMADIADSASLHRGRLILCSTQRSSPEIDQIRAASKIANTQMQQGLKAHVPAPAIRSQHKVEQLTGEPLAAVAYPMSPTTMQERERFLKEPQGTIPVPSDRPESRMKELWGGRPPSELIASNLPTYFPQYDKSEIDKTVRMSMRRSRRISRATNRLSTYSNFSVNSTLRDAPPLPTIADEYLSQGIRSTVRPWSAIRGGNRDSILSSVLDPLEEEDSPSDIGTPGTPGVPFVTFTPSAGPGPGIDGDLTMSEDDESTYMARPQSGLRSIVADTNQWLSKRISQMVQEDSDEEDTELSDFLENSSSWDNVKYMKGALIGQGSFGSVYLALHAVTGELMAVKQVEMPAENDKDAKKDTMIEALKHEIGLLRELKHANIVQYLGSNSDDQHLNIFLEYVPGGSVARMLVNYGPLPEGMIQNFVRQILHGLAYLHSQDIIHRDIKGANILVDNKGTVKISDFGISKRVEASTLLSKPGARVSMQGSVFWMAPEVVKQTSYTKKSDIWSLGCLVVEMFTGTHPHPNCSQIQAIFKIGSMPDCRPGVPDDASDAMSDFLLSTFEIDHENRPSSEALLDHRFCAGA